MCVWKQPGVFPKCLVGAIWDAFRENTPKRPRKEPSLLGKYGYNMVCFLILLETHHCTLKCILDCFQCWAAGQNAKLASLHNLTKSCQAVPIWLNTTELTHIHKKLILSLAYAVLCSSAVVPGIAPQGSLPLSLSAVGLCLIRILAV